MKIKRGKYYLQVLGLNDTLHLTANESKNSPDRNIFFIKDLNYDRVVNAVRNWEKNYNEKFVIVPLGADIRIKRYL